MTPDLLTFVLVTFHLLIDLILLALVIYFRASPRRAPAPFDAIIGEEPIPRCVVCHRRKDLTRIKSGAHYCARHLEGRT